MAVNRVLERFSSEEGSSAVEFAIVASLLIVLTLGLIEFGRGLLVHNEISYLADLGARDMLLDPAVSDSTLASHLHADFSGSTSLLAVTTARETIDGVEYRTVSVSYPLTLLVPGLSDRALRLHLTRRVAIN